MDQNTPRETSKEQANTEQGAVRTALVVLALCFTLAVLGRGLSESFTVFLKPISENFGWDRAQVVSIYSLTWLISGLTAPLVGIGGTASAVPMAIVMFTLASGAVVVDRWR